MAKNSKSQVKCSKCGATPKSYRYKLTNSSLGETVDVTVHSTDELESTRKKVMKIIYSMPEDWHG